MVPYAIHSDAYFAVCKVATPHVVAFLPNVDRCLWAKTQ